MARPPEIRTGPCGIPLTLKAAVFQAHRMGWTCDETAYETGWSASNLRKASSRMGVSFPYAGVGPKPKKPPYGPFAK